MCRLKSAAAALGALARMVFSVKKVLGWRIGGKLFGATQAGVNLLR